MTGHLLSVLPLACVMVAGPQFLSAIFLATCERWARDTVAYLAGAAIAVTLVISVVYLIFRLIGRAAGPAHHSAAHRWIDLGVLVLLVVLAGVVYRRRGQSEPPRWMGMLETATGRLSFILGFLLLGFFPSDLLTSVAVGAHIGGQADPWWHAVVFVLLTVVLLAIPALLVAVLGRRASAVLPKVRDWMNLNSWIVSEVVIAFFIAITGLGLASG